MRWFSHDTDAHDDIKLRRVLRKFGPEGYGLFWLLIEILAKEGNGGIDIKRYPIADLAGDFYTDPLILQKVIDLMVEEGLFDGEKLKRGFIYSPSLENRADTYTKRTKRKEGLEVEPDEIRMAREKFALAWNGKGMTDFQTWNVHRINQFRVRMQSEHFQRNHLLAIEKMASSAFCRGKVSGDGRKWKADIDWFLTNDLNYVKALEGKYDDQEEEKLTRFKTL
jgi:hypothetical protein